MGRRSGAGVSTDASAPFSFELRSSDFHVPEDVQRYTRTKVEAKLGKLGHRLLSVVVHIKDINGARGGIDKSCHMEAQLAGLAPVNVVETHNDLRAAIDITINRFEDAVRRQLDKHGNRPHHRDRSSVRDGKSAGA